MLLFSAGDAPSQGWAAAEGGPTAAPDQPGSNHIRWRAAGCSGGTSSSGGGGGGWAMLGLLAKALPAGGRGAAAAATELAGAQLLYSVEWQAHSSSSGTGGSRKDDLTAAAGEAQRAPQPPMAAAAAAWSFGGRAVAVRHAPWHSDAGWAAANLAAVQKVGRLSCC
jgi:hypothetical protein